MPQGSILEPMLFVMCITDLHKGIYEIIVQFANDMSFIINVKNQSKIYPKIKN